jgi:hypothetical protein
MNKTLSNKIKSFGILLFSLSIVACNDGSSGPTKYAYFTNHGKNTYTQCSVGSNGIISTTCVTVKPESQNQLRFNNMYGIAFNDSYAYLTQGSNGYTQCSVGRRGIESGSCVNIPRLSDELDYPYGIAFN